MGLLSLIDNYIWEIEKEDNFDYNDLFNLLICNKKSQSLNTNYILRGINNCIKNPPFYLLLLDWSSFSIC